jgi:hypothetical protein
LGFARADASQAPMAALRDE